MVWIDSDYAATLTPSPSVTGGLGSGAGQNNPGGGYSTPVQTTYEPPQTYGPTQPQRQYAPSADPNGQYYSDDGGATWLWEDFPATGDADMGIGGSAAQMPGYGMGFQSNPPYAFQDPGLGYETTRADDVYPSADPGFEWRKPGGSGDDAWQMYYTDPNYNPNWYQDAYREWADQPMPQQNRVGRAGMWDQFATVGEAYADWTRGEQAGDYRSNTAMPTPMWGSGDPEVAQWQGNPQWQQPSQYDVPLEEDSFWQQQFNTNRNNGGWGSAFSMLNDPFGIAQGAAESGDSIGGFSPATTPGEGFSRAMYPFDYISEIGGSVTDAQLSGLNQARHGDIWGANKTSLGGFSEAYGDLTNPNEAVGEFRDRPWYQQLGYGAVFDPTAVLGIGKVDEGIDLARRAPDLIDAAKPAMRGLGQYGSDVASGLGRAAPSPYSFEDIVRPVREEIPIPTIGGAADELPDSVSGLTASLRQKYPGVDVLVLDTSGRTSGRKVMDVANVVVGDEVRGQGTGTRILREITDWADANGYTVTLNADPTVGGVKGTRPNIKRLTDWYEQFGFVRNTGRNMDYELSSPLTDYQMVRQPKPGKPQRPAKDTPDVTMPRGADEAPDVLAAKRALIDALDKEANIRKVGTAAREIHEGRVAQAGGIRGQLDEGLAEGLSGQELVDKARGGAAVGTLRRTFADAPELTPEVRTALMDDVTRQFQAEEISPFDFLRGSKALGKVLDGDMNLLPSEAKVLRQILGDEVVDRIISARNVDPNALTRAQEARLAAQNTAREETLLARAEKVAAQAEARATRATGTAQETLDRAAFRDKWQAISKRNDADEIRTLLADRFMTPEERSIAIKAVTKESEKAQRAAGAATDAVWARAAKADPEAETLRRNAQEVLAKQVSDPQLRDQMERTIALWTDQNRVRLDAIKLSMPDIVNAVRAATTGQLKDSWLTAAAYRKADLVNALEAQGLETEFAKKVANAMFERELKLKYPKGVPEDIAKQVQMTKSLPYGESEGFSKLGGISQDMKNSAFGIDFGIMGQQVLHAFRYGGPNIMAGAVNELLSALHLPSVRLFGNNIPREVEMLLDGVNVGASTGISDFSRQSSMLSWLGKPGKVLDQKVYLPLADKLTDLQFRTVLGTVRRWNYEGNLLISKLAGADITNAKVRATAGDYANANTSYGRLAINTTRREAERGLLLTPSMRRAQINQILQVGKLLAPTASPQQRILAAATIASWGASTLVIGKLLHDYAGVGDFEWDPSKPGYGNITLKNGYVVNLYPQEQIMKTLARSARILTDLEDSDWTELAKEWGKLAMGSSSPPLQGAEKGAGFGYQPGEGYKFGDYGEGMSPVQRALAMLPLPTIASNYMQGDAFTTAVGAGGIPAYKESEYAARERKLKEDPAFGKGFYDLEPAQQKAAEEKYGILRSRNEETAERQIFSDDLRASNTAEQEKFDRWLAAGKKDDGTPYTGADWREDRKDINQRLSDQFDVLYRDMPPKADADKTPLDRYYDAISAAKTGEVVDWDKVDTWLSGQDQNTRDYIARNTGIHDTGTEKQYRYEVGKLADSGYFDLESGKREARQADPELGYLVRKWGYSPVSVRAEDLTAEAAKQQAIDDASLASGDITPDQWRDNYHDRSLALRSKKDEIYAAFKDEGISTEPLDQYFATIDANRNSNGVGVNWDEVDKWVAQQPIEVQQLIDQATLGKGLTPVVNEYRQAVRTIEESGYWDIPDRLVDRFGFKDLGYGGESASEVLGNIRQEIYGRVIVKTGGNVAEAQALTGIVFDALTKDYNKVLGDVRRAIRDGNPALAAELYEWGYYEPGKEETAEFLAASR